MATFQRYGMSEFKTLVNATTFNVVKNPKTSKLFVAATNGQSYKCQGDIDVKQPVEWLVVDGEVDDACLINQGRGTEVLASF
jgi:hypothetical protein